MKEIEMVKVLGFPAVKIKGTSIMMNINDYNIWVDGKKYQTTKANLIFGLVAEEKIKPKDVINLLVYTETLQHGDDYIIDLYNGIKTLDDIANDYYNNTEKGNNYIFRDNYGTIVFNNKKDFYLRLGENFPNIPEYYGRRYDYKYAVFTHKNTIQYVWNEVSNNKNYDIVDEAKKLFEYFPWVYEDKFEEEYIEGKDLKKAIRQKEVEERRREEISEIYDELFEKHFLPVGEEDNICGYVYSDRFSSDAYYITREPIPRFIEMTKYDAVRMVRAKKFKKYKGMGDFKEFEGFISDLNAFTSKEDVLNWLKEIGDSIYHTFITYQSL